ncbi:MAG: hypothetical protein J6J11_01640 [Treponema sp.]|nr:hypothetical protein [Clostridia bacterium]MBP3607006.1 hypothetical protein [Treponema sp.]
MELKKYEVEIDGEVFKFDQFDWDYPQTDSESSSPSDDNILYRDVLPRRMKFSATKEFPDEKIASKLLLMRKKDSATVNFWDLETRSRVTRIMYPVCDAVKAKTLFLENGEELFTCESIQVRFTQMIPDEFVNV